MPQRELEYAPLASSVLLPTPCVMTRRTAASATPNSCTDCADAAPASAAIASATDVFFMSPGTPLVKTLSSG